MNSSVNSYRHYTVTELVTFVTVTITVTVKSVKLKSKNNECKKCTKMQDFGNYQ